MLKIVEVPCIDSQVEQTALPTKSSTAGDTDISVCRPLSTLPFIPKYPGQDAVFATLPSAFFLPDEGCYVVHITLGEAHLLRPGVASPLCPANVDGVVGKVSKSLNVASFGAPVYGGVGNRNIEIKIFPLDLGQTIDAFIRVKYQEDTARTGKDKPRKRPFEEITLEVPTPGLQGRTAVRASFAPVTE